MAAKIAKTVVTPGSTFEIGEFKGRPVVEISLPAKEGTQYVDRVIFGARKAYAVLEHLDSIREFVAQLCETEAKDEPVAAKSPKTGRTFSDMVQSQRKQPKASDFEAKPVKAKAKPAKAKVARR
jgi:hypothetical protein